jgi:hypothetical protein
MEGGDDDQQVRAAKARRGRNLALALLLAGLVTLIFIMTMVRLGAQY